MAARIAKSEWLLLAGLVPAVVVGPLLLRGNEETHQQFERNAAVIRSMTAAERARVERNYELFQQMPPDEQQRWRTFHQTLESDHRSPQPRIGPALDLYTGWLSTTPSYVREELRRTTNVEMRISLVREAVDEQLATRLAATTPWHGYVRLLSSADVQSLIALFEERLQEPERDALVDADGKALTGSARSLKVLELLKRRYGQATGLLRDGTFLERVRAIVPDDRLPRDGDRPPQHAAILPMLRLSLLTQVEMERRKLNLSDAALATFVESLPVADQEELLQLPANEFRPQLERRYLEADLLSRFGVDLQEAMAFLMLPRGGRGPEGDFPGRRGIVRPGRDFPRDMPRGPRDGGDRGPQGRPPGDRPFDGRPPEGRGRPEGRPRNDFEGERFRPN